MQDIFPLSTSQGTANLVRILEPHSCTTNYNDPTEVIVAEVRLIYTKKLSHPYNMMIYSYKSILSWEYQLIEEFYRRMNGRYETFYAVDWNARYRVLAATSGSVTLDRINGLDATTGFGGNTLVLYNPTYSGVNKAILTIATITSNTRVVTVNEAVSTPLALSAGTYIYVLYPCMFDTATLQPTMVDFCIQHDIINFKGFGNKSLYGAVIDINIPLVQVGVMK